MSVDPACRPAVRSVAMRAWPLGLASFAGMLACGNAHDVSVANQPLLTLHGHVDRSALTRVDGDAPLVASLLWAAVPTINPVCVPLPPPTSIAAECPDPYGMSYGDFSAGAPVDDAGDFDLTIFDLPAIALSVGDDTTRISYGSLVVLEDIDRDGQPTFPRPSDADQRRAFQGTSPVSHTDRVVAATFHSLDAPQLRIAFREGGFVAPSNFYPACAFPDASAPGVPPPGFSILAVPPYAVPLPDPDACHVMSIDARIEVPPISPSDGLGIVCRPVQEADFVVRQPQGRSTPHGDLHCLDSNVLVSLSSGGLCPTLQSFALSGCRQDPHCVTPEWTDPAPEWWSKACP